MNVRVTRMVAVALAVATVFSCDRRKQGRAGEPSVRELIRDGRHRFQRGDLDGALDRYRAAVKKAPRSAQAQNLLGMALRYKYYETGDSTYRDEEVTAFRTAVRLKSGWVTPLTNLATTLWQTGKRDEAARLYARVLKLAPNHPDKAAIGRRIAAASGSGEPPTADRPPAGARKPETADPMARKARTPETADPKARKTEAADPMARKTSAREVP